jgi:L-ascorbate metabolism protein UlaG (beta-lactamase superfamily)
MTCAGTITWWGAAGVELTVRDSRLLIDPYLTPRHVRGDCICITREDHDHCHEATLERLVADPGFERIVVPASCMVMSQLDTPSAPGARDLGFVDPQRLTVLHPKYTRRPRKLVDGPVELSVGGFDIEGIESNESDPVTVLGAQCWGKRYKPADGRSWPAATGAYVGSGRLPPLGYVIEHVETGLTWYHPGDLQDAFDAQRELRGRIDYLFLPTASIEGVELSLVDNVRPRFVIPIHHRPANAKFPITVEIPEAKLTTTDLQRGRPRAWASPDVYRRELGAMMEAHWYPSSPRALERVRDIAPELLELGAEVLVLEAGVPHEMKARR